MIGDLHPLTKFSHSAMLHVTRMPIYVIFKDPIDYPGKYVARVFDINQPTPFCTVRDTYEEIIATIPDFLVKFQRAPEDDRHIVETWM